MINKGVILTDKFMPKVNCGLFRWLIVPIFTCIVAMLLTPSPVSAYTMSISTSIDAAVDITPSDDSSSSARITNDKVEIVTNCKAGYNLTLSSSVNDNNLYLDGDSSNNTSGTYFTPSNGTTALNNATNTWGYFFSSYSRGQSPTVPTTTSVFSPVPTLNSTPAVLKTTTQTASSTDIDDILNVYLGVNMDNGMTPGSYKMIPESNQPGASSGVLTYFLTMDGGCRNYTVSFNPNGGTGTMDPQDIAVGEATNLVPNSYTAPALGESYQNAAGTTIPATAGKMWTFWGWNTAIDGSGDWYKDRESVTDLAASGSIITLYAQWKQATLADLIPDPNPSPSNPKTIDHDTMQDMSAAACWNSEKFVAIGTPYGQATLKDSRDGTLRTYTVAKLPDGLCWMTQNLNLGTSTPITLTANDTDLEEGTTFTLPASNPTDFTTGTGQANTNKATVYNDVTVPDYTVNSTVYSGKINAYYSYAAATADTSTYGKGSAVVQINTSICPRNWDLPTNVQYYVLKTKGSITSYNNTNASYVGKNAGNEPYYFIYGGYRKAAGAEVNATNFNNPSTHGYLWTANNYSTTQGRGTYAYSSGLYNNATATSYYKYYGLGVRCVSNMDDAAYTITYTNTATSATQTQEMVMGESAPIQPVTTWTRTNYRLMGWDTNSSGTNVVYTTGQSITPSSDMTLYTVWKPSYTLQYNGNGSDAGVMTNVKHTNVIEGDTFDLFASNFSKTGYGFAGWSFDQNATPGGASKIYGPNEAIEAPAPSTPGETKTLYAVWVPAETGVYMQTWNGCSSMNVGDVIALKDQRDNNVYTVGKLADENCWMMENLRLDTANSSDATKAQGFGGVFVGLADPESANFRSVTTANTLNGTTLYSTSNITGSYQSYRFPRYNNSNTNARATNPSVTDNRANTTSAHYNSLSVATYSYGNYYTWAAALANTNDYTGPTATVDGKTSETVGTSICPAGWKLPYGRSTGNGATSGGFSYLDIQLGGTGLVSSTNTNPSGVVMSRAWRAFPNNFIYSSQYNNSSVINWGASGYYWSSTANVYSSSVSLTLLSGEVQPGQGASAKYIGLSIRCLIKSSYTITYNGNNADSGIGMSVQHTNVKNNDEISLYAANFKKAGHGFAGWSTEQLNPSSATFSDDLADAIDDGLVFGPNETITVNNTIIGKAINGEIKLYAIWLPSAGNIQNWNGCSTLDIGDITALTDTRDNNVYTVAKLADGDCWMIENLRLNTTGSDDETKAQSFGGVFAGLASSETSNFSNSTAANSLYYSDTQSGTATIDIGANNNPGYRFPRYNNSNVNSSESEMTSGDQNVYSYGNYYSWAATIANTTPNTTNNTSSSTSICPTGWRLPEGGDKDNETNNDFWDLIVNNINSGVKPSDYDSSSTPSYADSEARPISKKLRAFPNNFIYSGYIRTSTISYRNNNGTYWTSTSGGTSAYGMAFNRIAVRPGGNLNTKTGGNSVRCIAQKIYTINYNGNNADSGIGMSVENNNVKKDEEVTLYASNYKKAGYGFAGWSTEQLNPNASTFANDLASAVSNGLVFGPNETITLNSAIINKATNYEIKLYAIWIPSAGNIQNWNGCNSLANGAVTALTDTRDNNVYAVAKLADGNCWMIENLRLDSQNSTNRKLAQGYNSLFTGLANAESANFSDSTTANSKYSTTNVTGDNQSSRIPRYNNTNTASTVANMTSVNQNIYSYGNYYNTPAAMADTGDYTSWQKTVSSTSICPTGWHLPYGSNGTSVAGGNTSGGFVYLDTQLGGTGDNQETAEASNRWRKYPNNFIYSGNISGNTIENRGEAGSYISPTSGDATHTHHIGIGETTLWPGNGWTDKFVGESVRCVYGGFLYDAVEGQSKGTMASNNVTLNTTITQANSGVYTYDKATYGNPSDASNTYPVYFYRGILDTNAGLGTYGSNGLSDAYPNYVKTSDGTCWRIFRTTGSGGVKMIYNGKWSSNTCAKATTAARVANSTFSATSDAVSKSIVAVGYSYNATYAKTTATTATAVSTIFGSNSSYSANSTKSTIKNYIEGTYAGTLSTSIKNLLEPSAGYCNDRKLYSTSNGPVSESATIVPYGANQTSFRFGGYVRGYTTTSHATLTCPRATVDLYTTSSASNGNKQLTTPIALITMDELVFAGHGNPDSNTKFSTQSFLNTGSDWWTMSPGNRDGVPNISAWFLDYRSGNAGMEPTKNSKGVRPVISIKRGTAIKSGSGTATDPWIVE